jgi:glycerophosphoryl diester phosphodiesterase
MKYLLLLFVLSSCLACQPENFDIQNLNGNRIIILGHGGMGSGITHPTNTLESIMECIEIGADGSELDVQMTKDSVLIAFHDLDLSDNTDRSGKIIELNWQDIKGANYTNIPFLAYPVISLDELFSQIGDPGAYYFSFDLKFYNENEDIDVYRKRFANALIRLIDRYNFEEKIFIESQDEFFLTMLKKLKPSYKLFIYPSDFESGFQSAMENSLYGISTSLESATNEQISRAHENNIYVALWSVNSRGKNKKAIQKNPDIIQTDRLENLIDLLK